MLRGVDWALVTDVSVQPTAPLFKIQAVQGECVSLFEVFQISERRVEYPHHRGVPCVITGFRRSENENCSWNASPLKIRSLGCPEMSITTYQCALGSITEKRLSYS
jgi:hypothetical protein